MLVMVGFACVSVTCTCMVCVLPLRCGCFVIRISCKLLDGCHSPLNEVFSDEMSVCVGYGGLGCYMYMYGLCVPIKVWMHCN